MKRIFLFLLAACGSVHNALGQPTALVSDIAPGFKAGIPSQLIVWKNKLYFFADDASHGIQMWSYDEHTPPMYAHDINPGSPGIYISSSSTDVMISSGKLLFRGYSAFTGNELFSYDGTNPPVPLMSSPRSYHDPMWLTALNDVPYFFAYTFNQCIALFYCNTNGQIIKTRAEHCAPTSAPLMPVAFQGKLYYFENGRIAVYDPAVDSSTLLQAANIGAPPRVGYMLVVDNKLYYIGWEAGYGLELFSYDGSTVSRLTDIAPGSLNGVSWAATGASLTWYNGGIYFTGSADGANYQLYRYDPASGVASLACTINTSGSGLAGDLFVYRSKLYFRAFTEATGREVFVYDGTTCRLVADIWPGKKGSTGGAYPANFTVYNDHLYFAADDSTHGMELWGLNDATGVSNVSWPGKIVVFPNPAMTSATLSITLQSAQSLCISLTDISGREVFTTGLQSFVAGGNAVYIPLQGFAAGQYFYRISGSNGGLLASGAVMRQ